MPRISLNGGSGGGERSWQDSDAFTAMVSFRTEEIEGDDAGILTFVTEKGEVIERWATTVWNRLFLGEPADKKKGLPAKKSMLKDGDVVSVEALRETKIKGTPNRFRSFKIEILTGKDIPKSLR